MVGAAMVSVLVFPLLGLRLRGKEREAVPARTNVAGTEMW